MKFIIGRDSVPLIMRRLERNSLLAIACATVVADTIGLIAVPPLYTAIALIGVHSQVPSTYEARGDGGRSPTPSAILDRVGSSEIIAQTVDRFGLRRRSLFNRASPDDSAAITAIRSGLRVEQTADRNVWRLTYSSRRPAITAAILDDLLSGLKASDATETDHTRQTQHALINDLQGAGSYTRAAMTSAQAAQADLEAQRLAYVQRVEDLQAQLSTARTSHKSASVDVDQTVRGEGAPSLDKLRADRSALMAQQLELLHRYGARHPTIVDLRQRIHELDLQIEDGTHLESASNLLASSLRARTTQLRAFLAATQSSIASDTKRLALLSQLDQQLTAAQGRYKIALGHDLEAVLPAPLHVDVLTPAIAPSKPESSPARTLAVIVAIVAMMSAAADLIVRARQHQVFNSAGDVEHRLRLPVIGIIPRLSASRRRKRDDPQIPRPLDVLLNGQDAAFAQSFQVLQKSLGFPDKPPGRLVVAVCSALPNEGKTTISACLARSVAADGRSVVLVDCDGRRKALSRLFTDVAKPGLVQWAHGEVQLRDILTLDAPSGAYIVIHSSSDEVQDLSAPKHLKSLLRELEARFEVIILDTGPVLALVEARVIAALADQVFLVARWRTTPTKAVQLAVRLLGDAGATIRGVVLSLADRHQSVG